ncbi:hypothetical protein SISSUDRAFT_826544 [Sistotremastrum suecicum HHB10207 ss-3]|uniref:Uncharacterized protein n=1 Tax=Sistotremastrum suecicum HHB10207 ss-3 TaxID=1314776 RepID=A0A166CPI1_9AGAM|nr:hypothetical protein SISSUDRAFT_826544 [Sistotremastrum suecicum HHB10207 ss-3]
MHLIQKTLCSQCFISRRCRTRSRHAAGFFSVECRASLWALSCLASALRNSYPVLIAVPVLRPFRYLCRLHFGIGFHKPTIENLGSVVEISFKLDLHRLGQRTPSGFAQYWYQLLCDHSKRGAGVRRNQSSCFSRCWSPQWPYCSFSYSSARSATGNRGALIFLGSGLSSPTCTLEIKLESDGPSRHSLQLPFMHELEAATLAYMYYCQLWYYLTLYRWRGSSFTIQLYKRPR